MLRIAIQSKGRMNRECLDLLNAVGVELTVHDNSSILIRSTNFPAEVLFVEKDRIPELVASGSADLGICGEYVARQFGTPDNCIVKRLGFDKATLSLAIPSEIKYKGIEWFIGKRIATPYPDLLARFLKSHNVKANVRLMREQVYMAPKVGIADAICGRILSGSALVSEHLKDVEKVMDSEAVLIVSPTLSPQQRIIFDEFLLRIDAVQNAKGKKFVKMSVPEGSVDEVVSILSVQSLQSNLSVSHDAELANVSLIMDERRVWDILDRLKSLGVQNIAICPIDMIIP